MNDPDLRGRKLADACSLLDRLPAMITREFSNLGNDVIAALTDAARPLYAGCDCAKARTAYFAIENVISSVMDSIERLAASPDAPTRTSLLQYCIERFGYRSYLEVGCNDNACFARITAERKVGVDPVAGGTLRMTSDEYFARHDERFDIIFIDGLHTAEQVEKDAANALTRLNPGGLIVLHDCNPLFEVRQLVPRAADVWNGDVWKAFVRIRSRTDLDAICADFDHGCGIVRARPNGAPVRDLPSEPGWEALSRQRVEWLRLTPWDGVKSWLQS